MAVTQTDAPKNLVAQAHAVDVNCMLGRGVDRLWKFSTAAELLKHLDAFHIERALVYHSMAYDWNLADGNRMLLEELGNHRRLLPCVVASPHLGTAEMPDAKSYRAWLRKVRPAAVRLFPNSYKLHSFFAGELLDILDSLRLPVLINWGDLDPVALAEVSGEYAHIPFVLLKAGFKQSRSLFPLLEKRKNTYFSTSNFCDTDLLEEIVARYGARRLLFGSDMPRFHPGPALAIVCLADISAADKTLILGGNWRRLEGGVRWQ
jgi:predicted TIM-barrel fold metal-dependent hydrolase